MAKPTLLSRLQRCGLPLLASLMLPASVPAAPAPAILPLAEVRRGMIGTGRTVFAGGAIEDFEVEILGVLENSAPRHATILARLAGGPLAESGVIQGMSGSPVYVDGKLIGAVSSGYLFSLAAIAGITPIESMLAIGERGAADPDSRGLYLGATANVQERIRAIELGTFVSPLRVASRAAVVAGANLPIVPIVLSGLSPAVFESAAGFFRASGLVPVQGEGVARAIEPAAAATELGPGSPFAVEFIRGDFNIAAYGTVTSRDGDDILAFGHPLFDLGTVSFPIATADVVTVLPSTYSSFKISGLGRTVGALVQDRSSGVLGKMGAEAPMIPVHVGIKRGDNPLVGFSFEVATHRMLTPVLLEMSLTNTLTVIEKSIGASTLMLRGRIAIEGQDDIVLDHFASGDQAGPGLAGLVAAIAQVVLDNPFARARIRSVDVIFDYLEDNRWATLDRVWTDRQTVKAGESIGIRAFLTRVRQDGVSVPLDVRIPEDTPPGQLDLVVGDAAGFAQLEARSERYQPRSLAQIVSLINKLRNGSTLYVALSRPDAGIAVNGFRHNRLPPSAYQLMVGGAGAENLLPIRRVTLGEIEIPSTHQVVGLKTVSIQVEAANP